MTPELVNLMLSLSVHIHHWFYPVNCNLHLAFVFPTKIISLLGQGSINQHFLSSLDHEKLSFRLAFQRRTGELKPASPHHVEELISVLFHYSEVTFLRKFYSKGSA